jgi:fatty acid desaturase
MKIFEKLTDPEFKPRTKYNRLQKFLLDKIIDERDLVFVQYALKITCIIIPLAVLLFLPIPTLFWWGAAVLYIVFDLFVFNAPFILMLHCTSHRPFFKNEYKAFNQYIPWVLCPFFGQSPGTYFSHHLGMHHSENNLEDDLSSTMLYQRDSFLDFLKYFFSFFFGVIVSLVRYHHVRNRPKLRDKAIRGEIVFIGITILLLFINWPAAVVVFIVPLVYSRFTMMLGNWTQHAFVDYDDPNNCYKNSITCINTIYNRQCWNDGYHIDHHLRPTMHYTDYPGHFRKYAQEFADNKAMVFDGVHYLHVWYYLMTKNYQKLAKNLVNINNAFSSTEEAIAVMQARTRKMEARGITVKNYKAMVGKVG